MWATQKHMIATAAIALAAGMGLAASPAFATTLETLTLSESGFSNLVRTDAGEGSPGLVDYVGAFGTFEINFDAGQTVPIQPSPDLWLNGLATSSTVAGCVNNCATIPGVLTVTLNVSGLPSPISTSLGLLNAISGTLNTGMATTIDAYFNPDDSLTHDGSSIHMGSGSASDPPTAAFSLSPLFHVNTGAGPYSETWVWTVTADGLFHAGSGNTVGTQDRLEAVPEPASLTLLGGALLGLGLMRRRRRG